jgi:hypothetical protein
MGPCAPKKPETGDFWTNIHGWGEYRDGISVDLWGAELLTIRAARIVLAATVFVIGVLSGAGVAAWMMPLVWAKCSTRECGHEVWMGFYRGNLRLWARGLWIIFNHAELWRI